MSDLYDLEGSQKMIAAIVNDLSRRGVRRGSLDVSDLSLDEDLLDPALFLDSILWLEGEGIIRSSSEHSFTMDGTAHNYTLSAYGYRLLEQNFQGEMKLGQAVKEAAEGSRSFTGVGDFFGGLLGGFTKSMSS